MVHTLDKYTVQTFLADMDNQGDRDGITASSRGSLDSRQRRLDTSLYQQRAEALEGVLELRAQLPAAREVQGTGDILLKPFGPAGESLSQGDWLFGSPRG
jgi:NIMA (never in mitosis gene a)-related kinase